MSYAHDQPLVPGGAMAPGGAGCCHSPQTTQHSHPMSGPYLSHKTSSPDANRLDPAKSVVDHGRSISKHHPTQCISKAFLGDIPLCTDN